jgi:hypothetical protein
VSEWALARRRAPFSIFNTPECALLARVTTPDSILTVTGFACHRGGDSGVRDVMAEGKAPWVSVLNKSVFVKLILPCDCILFVFWLGVGAACQ